jgi:hypothetical protein
LLASTTAMIAMTMLPMPMMKNPKKMGRPIITR